MSVKSKNPQRDPSRLRNVFRRNNLLLTSFTAQAMYDLFYSMNGMNGMNGINDMNDTKRINGMNDMDGMKNTYTI